MPEPTITLKAKLSDFVVPNFKYYPTHLMDWDGPKHWAKLRLLQACERLDMPRDKWPSFPELRLPTAYGHGYAPAGGISVLAFNALYETEAEWRERNREMFERFLDKQAEMIRKIFQHEIQNGKLTKIKQVKGSAPLKLRYEWAARRYCLGLQYQEMSSDEHSPEAIRKTVTQILTEVGLRERK